MWSTCIRAARTGLIILVITALIFIPCDWLLKRTLPPVYQTGRYGWSPPANATVREAIQDTPGNFREIEVRYFEHGFKRWGDVATDKTKVLVVGDSFTHMQWVSNGEEWYSWLEKEFPDVELFVFGSGGFGTVQEYLVIDDFLDRIQPDLILLQFCRNDFKNNLYHYDLANYPHNNHGVRPYLEGDDIVWRLPLPFAGIRASSFAADRLLAVYDALRLRHVQRNQAAYRRRNKERQEHLWKVFGDDAMAVTNKLFSRLKKRVGGIPVYVMAPDNSGETVSRNHGFPFISMAEINDWGIQHGRMVVIPNNGHWNRLGNRLVGERLIEFLRPALLQIRRDKNQSARDRENVFRFSEKTISG